MCWIKVQVEPYDRNATIDIPLDNSKSLQAKEKELKAKEAELKRREQELKRKEDAIKQGVIIWLLAIIYFLATVHVAYFVWYRPLYCAMRTDSALSFAGFFLSYLLYIAFCIYAAIAPPIFLKGKSITKKQTCIALSTMESEYVAFGSAIQGAIWLRRFLRQMGVTAYAQETVLVYCDSTSAFAYTKDPKYHGKSKHIDTQYHFFRNKVTKGEVVLKHISTNNMLSDPMTKPIIRNSFLTHVKNMGLCRV